MKQNMKRLWLMVCMVFSLFALSACSAAGEDSQSLDAETSETLCSVTEGWSCVPGCRQKRSMRQRQRPSRRRIP